MKLYANDVNCKRNENYIYTVLCRKVHIGISFESKYSKIKIMGVTRGRLVAHLRPVSVWDIQYRHVAFWRCEGQCPKIGLIGKSKPSLKKFQIPP